MFLIVDSFRRSRPEVKNNLWNWFVERHRAFDQTPPKESDWTFCDGHQIPDHCPKQTDRVSCGPFVVMTACHWIRSGSLPSVKDWTQLDVPDYRRFILSTLIKANKSRQARMQQEAMEDIVDPEKRERELLEKEERELLEAQRDQQEKDLFLEFMQQPEEEEEEEEEELNKSADSTH